MLAPGILAMATFVAMVATVAQSQPSAYRVARTRIAPTAMNEAINGEIHRLPRVVTEQQH